MMNKFKVGDHVEIIKYGSLMWSKEQEPLSYPVLFKDEVVTIYDTNPQLVGQKGIVTKVSEIQGKYSYSLHGPNKTAWYDEQQLKLEMSNTNIETPSIAFTEDKFKKFKKIYKEADKNNQTSFMFEDKEILVSYAKYILEYLSETYE